MSDFKIAAGYVRCSTEMQEDSPEQQKKEIETFAALRKFKIVEWFVDFGKSGTTFDRRPAFQRLREKVEHKPEFQVVISYDESRWGRAIDAEENTFWRVYFRRHGVDVILVKTAVDPKHEFAPMLKAFEGVQASQYSKKLSELTLRGAKANGIYSSGGTAPYGYKRIAVNQKNGTERELSDGEWCVAGQEKVRWGKGDEAEIRTVEEIFRLRAQGMACVLIAERLNSRGVPCPKRGRWKNQDRKWSAITIKTLIENPSYRGARVYNRNSMSKIQAQLKGFELRSGFAYPHWRNGSEEWVIVENAHQPIVSSDIWARANSTSSRDPGRSRNRFTYSSRYLLTGLIRCADCGFPFQGNTTTSKGRAYHRYIDGGWQNKRVCTHYSVRREVLEDFAINSIKDMVCDPDTALKVERCLRHLIEQKPKRRMTDLRELQLEIADCENKLGALTTAVEAGGSISVLVDRIKQVESRKAELEARLQRHEENALPSSSIIDIQKQVADFLLNFEGKFEKAPMFEKKLLVQKFISQITIDRRNRVARFALRQIPTVTPQLQELYENKRALTEVVSARSSGGRT